MKKFSIPDLLMTGWNRTKNNYPEILGIMLIIVLFCLSNNMIDKFVDLTDDASSNLMGFFLHFGLIILEIIFGINVIKQGLIVIRGGKIHLRKLFDYPHEFWKYLGGQLLTGLIVIAGLICFIVPGIYLLLRLMFMKQVLVDQKLDPIESMEKCFAMTRGHAWNLFVFLVTLLIFNLAGLLVFVIGLAVTIPVTFFAFLSLYEIFKHQA